MEAREIPHKGGRTFGYRVSDGHSVLAYLPDHCPTVLGPGPDGWGEYHPAALDLADRADLLIHDSFLLAAEVAAEARSATRRPSTRSALGRRAGARRVALFHHKPDRTDDELDRLAAAFAGRAAARPASWWRPRAGYSSYEPGCPPPPGRPGGSGGSRASFRPPGGPIGPGAGCGRQ